MLSKVKYIITTGLQNVTERERGAGSGRRRVNDIDFQYTTMFIANASNQLVWLLPKLFIPLQAVLVLLLQI